MKTHNSNTRYADDTFHSENNNIESNKAFGKLETVPWEKRTHQSTCVEDPVPLDLACLWVCARFYIRNHRMPSVSPVRLEEKKNEYQKQTHPIELVFRQQTTAGNGATGMEIAKAKPPLSISSATPCVWDTGTLPPIGIDVQLSTSVEPGPAN